MNEPLVYIIVLNWNGWEETLQCLTSIRLLDYSNYVLVVIDNGSTNDSIEKIKSWAKSPENNILAQHDELRVQYIEYDRLMAENGGSADCEKIIWQLSSNKKMVIIRNGTNFGYAGGNNVGMQYALSKNDGDYIWLLNNDTIVDNGSLKHLVNCSQEHDNCALISPKISYYFNPEKTWFEGGVLNPWTATSKHVELSKFKSSKNKFITGCGMFIPLKIVQKVGLLDDSLFLYSEDLDYSIRVALSGFKMIVNKDSTIAHVVSASSQSRSAFAYYHHIKNSIVVTCRYYGRNKLLTIIPFHLIKLSMLILSGKCTKEAANGYRAGLREGIKSVLGKN